MIDEKKKPVEVQEEEQDDKEIQLEEVDDYDNTFFDVPTDEIELEVDIATMLAKIEAECSKMKNK